MRMNANPDQEECSSQSENAQHKIQIVTKLMHCNMCVLYEMWKVPNCIITNF